MPNFRSAEHLPNNRPGRKPRHPSWLPKQRRGVTPQMIGRYPDYNVLDAMGSWDEATKKLVLARLEPPGPLRFFTPDEEPTLRAFCDTVMAQDSEPRVPVAEAVDTKLADGKLDGYTYAGMPDDRDTWRLVLRGLEEEAQERFGEATFASLDADRQIEIVADLASGRLRLRGEVWEHIDASRAWSVCMRAILAGFYSHPYAWNEIGFGGPAYPRGFMRMGPVGTLEPFERPGATDEDPVEMAQELEP